MRHAILVFILLGVSNFATASFRCSDLPNVKEIFREQVFEAAISCIVDDGESEKYASVVLAFDGGITRYSNHALIDIFQQKKA